jgi:hypothetical protein
MRRNVARGLTGLSEADLRRDRDRPHPYREIVDEFVFWWLLDFG